MDRKEFFSAVAVLTQFIELADKAYPEASGNSSLQGRNITQGSEEEDTTHGS
jgi:hypothetical protein